jgi:hypothetical protein
VSSFATIEKPGLADASTAVTSRPLPSPPVGK